LKFLQLVLRSFAEVSNFKGVASQVTAGDMTFVASFLKTLPVVGGSTMDIGINGRLYFAKRS
jgi:hypothetical protein